MRHFPYSSYLRTHRDTWALSQAELAHLFGLKSGTTISRYEKLLRTPKVEVIVASEFIFGEHARRIFPSLYSAVEGQVLGRALLLRDTLDGAAGKSADRKRELIELIVERSQNDRPYV
jgi:transcriptional regulator with XRE-family HTH domain